MNLDPNLSNIMSGIGPELPPHLLANRKRKQEEDAENETAASSGANSSPNQSDGEKRRRVLGPAMPPAPLDERPDTQRQRVEESDSSDGDEFGPAMPSNKHEASLHGPNGSNEASLPQSTTPPPEEKLRRDEWMTMPPKQDDLAARMDPTKQRPRAFNTGKGARGPNALDDDSSAWHETPEQKQKRLADEMMGVSKPSNVGPQKPPKTAAAARDEAAAQKIREHTVCVSFPDLHSNEDRAMLFQLLTRDIGEDSWAIVAGPAPRK